MNKKELYGRLYFVAYEDDGPQRWCPQSMYYTNKWNLLYVFDSDDRFREFCDNIKKINKEGNSARKNPRITNWWVIDDINKEVLDKTETKFIEKYTKEGW